MERRHGKPVSHERDQGVPPVEVPTEALSPDTLRSVLESYILREGTDYGAQELSLEAKVANLRRKIEAGAAHLVFDPETESITFLPKSEWKKLNLAPT